MADTVELAVVGAGPAGLAAAIEAAQRGLHVVLIDLYARPGGQYFKQRPAEFRATEGGRSHQADGAKAEGQELLDALARAGVPVIHDTVVWGIFAAEEPLRAPPNAREGEEGYLLCLYGPLGMPRRLRARKVILAPGAYDRPVPFPGWTLPGVMTAGAAQVLIKAQGVLPGQRVLLSGTGPLQLALASQLVDGGATIVAILDANPFPWSAWRHALAVWGQGQRIREGWEYWRTIRRAGVPWRFGCSVLRAEGNGQVERAVIGRVGRRRDRPEEELAVDTICLGYGFVPSAQLSFQAGAEHRYRPDLGTYVPLRNANLETTLAGLFVAGDGAEIGGKDVALLEGRLAAMAAAAQLGRPAEPPRIESTRRELARQRRFAAVLNQLFPFPPALWSLMTDDTILCRCEEVTVGEVRRAVADGATTPVAVKNLTRAGMGRCQGRMCSGPLAHLVARELGQTAVSAGTLAPRPPIVPVPLEGLLE